MSYFQGALPRFNRYIADIKLKFCPFADLRLDSRAPKYWISSRPLADYDIVACTAVVENFDY